MSRGFDFNHQAADNNCPSPNDDQPAIASKQALPAWAEDASPNVFALIAAALALTLSLIAFAPHFWLWHQPVEGSFEWTRGLAFEEQVANPSSPTIEPALQWRCLPAAIARVLKMKGHSAFLIGWLGVISLLTGIARWMIDHTGNRMAAFAATLLVAESSAVIVPTGWLGINDAWAWLGLAAVAFSRRQLVFATALLLCPWVDERFLLALPLALWARQILVGRKPFLGQLSFAGACVTPYLLLRIWAAWSGTDATSGVFIRKCLDDFGHYAPCAPLGWWMGWRLAWLLPLWSGWLLWQDGKTSSITLGLGAAATGLALATFLAADLSRSAAMLLPGILASFVLITKRNPSLFAGHSLALAVTNLFVPAAHVVSVKIALISCLPLEWWRWIHS